MRKISIAAIILTLFFLSSGVFAQEKSQNELETRLTQICQKWRPDGRLGVFDWEIREGNVLAVKTTSAEARKAVFDLMNDEYPDWKTELTLTPQENPALNGRFYGVVNFSVVNMRYGPDYSAEMGTQALLGTPIRIVDVSPVPGWIRIQTPNGYLGYISSGSVVAMNRDEFNAWIRSPKIVWTDFFGFVYSEPNEASATISDVVAGNVLTLKSADDERFYQVSFPDGRVGWIAKKSSVPFDEWLATRDFSEENIVATARKFLGFPYLWAGTSPKGLDCSGFVWTVLFLNRTIVLRDASQQRRDGTEIDVSDGFQNLRPGDLLYFGTKKSPTERKITHTGIYIGDSEFIHCAVSVRIDSFDPKRPNYSESLTNRLVQATRLVGVPSSETFMPVQDNKFYQPVESRATEEKR